MSRKRSLASVAIVTIIAQAGKEREDRPMEARNAARFRIIALFEELTDAELARVAERCVVRHYERNSQILGEQDRTDEVFFILEGAARANSMTPGGREVIFSEL